MLTIILVKMLNADEGDNGDVLSTSTWRRVPWPLVVVREEWGLAVEVTF